MGTSDHSRGLKRQRFDVDHEPPASAAVRISGATPLFFLHGKNNFIFLPPQPE